MDGLETLIEAARRAREGGRPELENLLRESAGFAHVLARARLGDSLAAEEASVEALARAARGFGTFRDPVAYPRWMARIVHRCVADVLRAGPSPEPIRSEIVDPGGDAADRAASAERDQRIRGVVADLPPRLRRPILLHYVEGLSYRETAHVLSVGLGTVARRMNRALAEIRRALGGEP